MAKKRKLTTTGKRATPVVEYNNRAAVKAYLDALEHPLKPVVKALRVAILGADSAITEGIKWNSVSFYCHGWFATLGVRPKQAVQVVLHHGAKVRDNTLLHRTIDDPGKLLTWLATDRAIIRFASVKELTSRKAAFVKLIQQWAAYQVQLAEAAGRDTV